MENHEIKNQYGNHIIEEDLRKEICYILDRGLDYSYVDGVKVEIVKDFRTDGERETVVNVSSCELAV